MQRCKRHGLFFIINCDILTIMQSEEIRRRFLAFFEKRGHAVIPSASLVPNKDDTSVLFNTAGMQPLIPYLMGTEHPQGKRLINIQKCVRTQDIEEVGDKTHDTFFEMLGNWSLGDYFKEDAIKWSYDILTSKEEGFGLDPKRLYITVFGGNGDAPQDDESFNIWKKYIPENRIYFLTWNGKKEPNWWDAGDNGPCGPDTEMFYDVTVHGLGDMNKEEYLAADERQDVVEIWNDVFMEYEKRDGKVIGKLKQKNVDTGGGLERVAMAAQGKDNIFDTDLFSSMISKIKEASNNFDVKSERVVADHIRTSVLMLSDGVEPSNKDRGYILRRLLRRAWVFEYKSKLSPEVFEDLIIKVIEKYKSHYPALEENRDKIINLYFAERSKFKVALESGLKQVEKGDDPFILFTRYGLPLEIIEGVVSVDRAKFQAQMEEHKQISSVAGENKFKN